MAKSKLSDEALLRTVVSQPYANQIVNGIRSPSLQTALKIYDATGLRYGFLDGASPAEIRIIKQRYNRPLSTPTKRRGK